jgi:predicted RNA binding protein YcfA (HicA-like mRNA interferase family)
MGGKIRPFNAKQLEQLLSRYGFALLSQKGSHKKWRNPETGQQVIVPYHGGRDLPLGTLRNILTTAEIPESEWRT